MVESTEKNRGFSQQTAGEGTIYPPQYFMRLGLTRREALFFAERWSNTPQPPEALRQCVIAERSNREAATEMSSK